MAPGRPTCLAESRRRIRFRGTESYQHVESVVDILIVLKEHERSIDFRESELTYYLYGSCYLTLSRKVDAKYLRCLSCMDRIESGAMLYLCRSVFGTPSSGS